MEKWLTTKTKIALEKTAKYHKNTEHLESTLYIYTETNTIIDPNHREDVVKKRFGCIR